MSPLPALPFIPIITTIPTPETTDLPTIIPTSVTLDRDLPTVIPTPETTDLPTIIPTPTSETPAPTSQSSTNPLPTTPTTTSTLSLSTSERPTSDTTQTTPPTTLSTPTTTSQSTQTSMSITAGGSTGTLTSVVAVTPTGSIGPSGNSAPGTSKTFFQNTGAVAGVFTVVGLIVVGLLIALVTNTLRRRRAKRFDREIEGAAAEATAVPAPAFLDDDDDPYGPRVYGTGAGAGFGAGGYGHGGGDGYDNNDNGYSPDRAAYSDVSSHGTFEQPAMNASGYPGETREPGGYANATRVGSGGDGYSGFSTPQYVHQHQRQQHEADMKRNLGTGHSVMDDVDPFDGYEPEAGPDSPSMYRQSHNAGDRASLPSTITRASLHPVWTAPVSLPAHRYTLSSDTRMTVPSITYPDSIYPVSTLPSYAGTVRSVSPPAYSDLSRTRSGQTLRGSLRKVSLYNGGAVEPMPDITHLEEARGRV